MTNLKLGAVAIVAVALVGCGGATSPSTALRTDTASYAISMFNPDNIDYTGNYIQITGTRDGLADLKYPCQSTFTVCLPLGVDGKTDASVEPIKDLGPPVNTNDPGSPGDGTWVFSYKIYNGPCDTGTELTGHNLICPASEPETLNPGATLTNNLLCKTYNGEKDVNVCIYDPNTGAKSGDCSSLTCKVALEACTANADCCSNVCGTDGKCAVEAAP